MRDFIAGYWFEFRWWLDPRLTNFLLWALGKVNPCKDNQLAYRLHNIADQYDTRPTGEWQ